MKDRMIRESAIIAVLKSYQAPQMNHHGGSSGKSLRERLIKLVKEIPDENPNKEIIGD